MHYFIILCTNILKTGISWHLNLNTVQTNTLTEFRLHSWDFIDQNVRLHSWDFTFHPRDMFSPNSYFTFHTLWFTLQTVDWTFLFIRLIFYRWLEDHLCLSSWSLLSHVNSYVWLQNTLISILMKTKRKWMDMLIRQINKKYYYSNQTLLVYPPTLITSLH